MKHLIIYVNPETESFSHRILETVKEYSLEKGHETQVRDLYAMNFNPVLSLEEIKALNKDGSVPADVSKEQDYLDWAEVVTFIYPIWWAIPAMMKGYFDRVFSYGYAYEYTEKGPKGLLKGKKVFRLNSMGTHREIYEKNGLRRDYESVIDEGILQSTGMKVVESKLFGPSPRNDKELGDKYLEEVKKIISQVL